MVAFKVVTILGDLFMEESYFSQALSNFTSDFAYKKAVWHLHDIGYSIPEIAGRLDYPLSQERIAKLIEEYERMKSGPEAEYTFVQDTDAYGRKSFRRVKRDGRM